MKGRCMAEGDPILIDRTKVFDPSLIENGFRIHRQSDVALSIERITKLSQIAVFYEENPATRRETLERQGFIALDAQAGYCLFQNGYFVFDLMMTMADKPADSEIVFDGSVFLGPNGAEHLLAAYHWHSETFHFTKGYKIWDSHKWKFRYREFNKQYGTPYSLCIAKSKMG